MTESAKEVFVNAICWMKQFDGQRPLLASKRAQSRALAYMYDGLTSVPDASGSNTALRIPSGANSARRGNAR
mgnify:CR=1 FL=1